MATGVSIYKGEDDPPLRADSEYPEWLWALAEPAPTVAELQRLYEGEGLTLKEVRWANISHFVSHFDTTAVGAADAAVMALQKQNAHQGVQLPEAEGVTPLRPPCVAESNNIRDRPGR